MCECGYMCSGHGVRGLCESLYVYLRLYEGLCLFVTVTVYAFVCCQLVNMGIVCFGGSIQEVCVCDVGVHWLAVSIAGASGK